MTNEEKQAALELCEGNILKLKGTISTFEAISPELDILSKLRSELIIQRAGFAALTGQPDYWKQRAEAAEARASNLNDGWLNAIEERDKARAKLVELAQQKPIGWLNDAYLGRGVIDGEVGEDDFGPGYIPIYRHPFNDVPAPAADLAELVPSVCDGKEQEAFESYARQKGLDLSRHPLHYLFQDNKRV